MSKADTSLFVPRKKIGDGEREAFALAVEFKADAVLVDDRDAAIEAQRQGILTIPTFAILEQAAARNLIDLARTVDAVRSTTFRLPQEKLIEAMINRDRQRKEAERESSIAKSHCMRAQALSSSSWCGSGGFDDTNNWYLRDANTGYLKALTG